MILGDYHTHTSYSKLGHGKGSVEDNVLSALSHGLREIALTDHGRAHGAYGISAKAFEKFYADVEQARARHPEIKIYAGVEGNFLSRDGKTDLDGYANLELAVCGYHRFVRGNLSLLAPNFFCKNSAKTVARNTDAYLNALDRYDINILSHIGEGCKVDLKAVGEVASRKGTYIEINGKHVTFSPDDLVLLASLGCKFLFDSDAHTPDRVGEVGEALKVYELSGLPLDLVHNVDRLPDFGGNV